MDFKVEGEGGGGGGKHGTLKSIVGHHGWSTRRIFLSSRLSRKAKLIIF